MPHKGQRIDKHYEIVRYFLGMLLAFTGAVIIAICAAIVRYPQNVTADIVLRFLGIGETMSVILALSFTAAHYVRRG